MRKVRQEMAGGVCSRRARRGRTRGKLHNNASSFAIENGLKGRSQENGGGARTGNSRN